MARPGHYLCQLESRCDCGSRFGVTLDASNANDGTVMVVDAASVAHETKVTVGIRTKDKIEITSACKEVRRS